MYPILVSGCPRSGTTWIGKMISLHKDVGYIHEAYNLIIRKNFPKDTVPFHFLSISENNRDQLYRKYSQIFSYQYLFFENFRERISLHNLINSIYHKFKFSSFHRNNKVPLIKDPYILLSTDWFVKKFDVRPIIIIRHPGPILDSFLRLKWDINLEELGLNDFRNANYNIDPEININQAKKVGYLWSLYYMQVIEFQKQYPNWLYLKYEDIILNKKRVFDEIFDYCDLKLDDSLRKKIISYSDNGHFPKQNDTNIDISVDDFLNGWKLRLDEEDIANLKSVLSKKVYEYFYSMDDW